MDISRLQYVAIIASLLLLGFIFGLIRKKKIKESYSILWLFFGFVFLFFSIWRKALDIFSLSIGISYPPAALFLILIVAYFFILVQFSVVVTKLSRNNLKLTQELALLQQKVDQLIKK